MLYHSNIKKEMKKQLMVGNYHALAEVKKVEGDWPVVIMIPFGVPWLAESCLEGLVKGKIIIERKEKEPK